MNLPSGEMAMSLSLAVEIEKMEINCGLIQMDSALTYAFQDK